VGAHEIIAETSRHDRSLHELEIEEISNRDGCTIGAVFAVKKEIRGK